MPLVGVITQREAALVVGYGLLFPGIVPVGFLASQPTATALVLEWAGGSALQSSTNVNGPYVTQLVSSPYTNLFIEPTRFFRVR